MNGCPVAGLSVQGRRPFGLTVNGKAIAAAGCGLPDTGNNAALTRTAQPARYPSSREVEGAGDRVSGLIRLRVCRWAKAL